MYKYTTEIYSDLDLHYYCKVCLFGLLYQSAYKYAENFQLENFMTNFTKQNNSNPDGQSFLPFRCLKLRQ